MKQGNTFQEMIKPLLVLVIICLVVSALLGFTHSVTAPIVEENERIAAEATRKAVLAGAESFTEIDCDTEALGIKSAYKEDSGKGYVITAGRKGYGGEVVVTVGIDGNGKVEVNDALAILRVAAKLGFTEHYRKKNHRTVRGRQYDAVTLVVEV